MHPLPKRAFKVIPGKDWDTPKELWGFRAPRLTGPAAARARAFLAAHASLLGLEGVVDGLVSRPPKVIPSLGGEHVVFAQQHRGRLVRRGYVSVHFDRTGRAYLVKSRAAPAKVLETADPGAVRVDARKAAARAERIVAPGAASWRVQRVEPTWFPRGARLVPAWRVRVSRESVRRREEWIVAIDARDGRTLSRWDNLSLAARGVGRVFDPSPAVTLDTSEGLHERRYGEIRPRAEAVARAYRTVRLPGLRGDADRLDGARVSTSATRPRARRADRRFVFGLESVADARAFAETMVYFHVDRAVRWLERLGFRGARAIFREPIRANAYGTYEDQSWYSSFERLLVFGYGEIDDAHDAETILHELGHAIQDAIVPNFGQSAEAAAMGEGFGDYFAASAFAEKKSRRYRDTVMSWDGITWGGDPPCVRRLDEPFTYESFDHDAEADEHDNGRIWSATLWDVRRKLGRRTTDRLVVEAHFQLDAHARFAQAARAILDADRNLHRGAHRAALARVFRARGIGPVE